MAFLIDTNVLSEVVRFDPDPRVREWLAQLPATQAFLSVLTLGEIARGVSLLPAGMRKDRLRSWLDHDLPQRFAGRMLDVDRVAAEVWGDLAARARHDGRPLPVVDGLLLATARAHGLTLATRNARDCAGRGVSVFDPWSGPEPSG
jgi:toxin FitB